jgi:eukaryotic-like serine/threonine-protein kinase
MAKQSASCDPGPAMDCAACHQPNVDGARFCAKCGALLPLPSAATQDSLIGQIVGGRYRVTQLLGEGGMGRVYLAEQQMGTNVRKVAVKTLQSQYAQDPQVLARFHRECGTVSELEHPNTIQFFDFGQTPDGQLYIAMEFVQGQSLADALQRGAMRPERVLKILAQVCGSLEEAHGRGVVHRDLKPDNVILTTRAGQADFVKVLDFGIAKRSEAKDQAQEQKLTQQGMVLGTPPYMSPEQFTGKELDARSDIYSLGVMAYEMLTGRLPFEADTPWQWATQHMTAAPFPFEQVPVAASVPSPMKRAILRSLAKERTERQANVRQFYDELASSGAGVGAGVSLPLPVAEGSGGTAAMPVIGAKEGTSGPALTPHPVAHATPGGQTFPTPPRARPSAEAARPGGKGLIIALAAAAGFLAVLGIIILAREMRPKEDIAVTSPLGPNTAATAAPTVALPPPAEPSADQAKDETPPPDPGKPIAPVAAPARKTSPPPAASPSPPPAPTLTGDAACAEAKRLADNGDAGGAARVFAGCSGASAGLAKSAIARSAPDAVKRRIFNGDCAGARALLASLNGIGAAGSAGAVLDAAPQCKK